MPCGLSPTSILRGVKMGDSRSCTSRSSSVSISTVTSWGQAVLEEEAEEKEGVEEKVVENEEEVEPPPWRRRRG